MRLLTLAALSLVVLVPVLGSGAQAGSKRLYPVYHNDHHYEKFKDHRGVHIRHLDYHDGDFFHKYDWAYPRFRTYIQTDTPLDYHPGYLQMQTGDDCDPHAVTGQFVPGPSYWYKPANLYPPARP